MLGFLCTLITFACISILITLYYEVYKPIWRERKKAKDGFATSEEIDALLHEAGIFDSPKIQKPINKIHLN